MLGKNYRSLLLFLFSFFFCYVNNENSHFFLDLHLLFVIVAFGQSKRFSLNGILHCNDGFLGAVLNGMRRIS